MRAHSLPRRSLLWLACRKKFHYQSPESAERAIAALRRQGVREPLRWYKCDERGCGGYHLSSGAIARFAGLLLLLALGTAHADGLTPLSSQRILDWSGRQTDVATLRNDTDTAQPFTVTHDGMVTRGFAAPGSTVTVITNPALPNGQPLIILQEGQ